MKVYLQTYKNNKDFNVRSVYIPEPLGWEGPFEFLQWGVYVGDTMAIIKKDNGEVMMAYPGQIKFEPGQEPVERNDK